jgi:catechol-2,3-dioxygenase
MPLVEINHYNLRTPREMMLRLKDYYCNILGLVEGPRPGFTSYGFWLYIGDNDVLHLSEYRGEGEPLTNVLTTLDHVAFTCTDMPAMEVHLQENDINYTIRDLPVIKTKQINFKDPVGNGIELNFLME